jgi:hypothetical protein
MPRKCTFAKPAPHSGTGGTRRFVRDGLEDGPFRPRRGSLDGRRSGDTPASPPSLRANRLCGSGSAPAPRCPRSGRPLPRAPAGHRRQRRSVRRSAIFAGFSRVGKGALAPCPPAESTQPIVPIGFGGHGAKSAFAHPTDWIDDFDLRRSRPGVRGVYHRARVRVTRWLRPRYALCLLKGCVVARTELAGRAKARPAGALRGSRIDVGCLRLRRASAAPSTCAASPTSCGRDACGSWRSIR